MSKGLLNVKGFEIRIIKVNEDDYISLTDIAKSKNEENPNAVIMNWIRNYSSIEFFRNLGNIK